MPVPKIDIMEKANAVPPIGIVVVRYSLVRYTINFYYYRAAG